MAQVIIHATVSLDGFIADSDGGADWMSGFSAAPEDEELVAMVMVGIDAVELAKGTAGDEKLVSSWVAASRGSAWRWG